MTEATNLIIGSGIAGLTLALKLADGGQKVHLIAKAGLTQSNTWYAQGGIASVLGGEDSFENHVKDTVIAGAGLCHPKVVEQVVRAGPRLVRELISMGVKFTNEIKGEGASHLHLTREGGHSHRRVIHADDWTGQAIISVLIERAREHPLITILENQMAIDLLTTDRYAPRFGQNRCVGAYVLDRLTQSIYAVRSENTFLCTGGHGKVYLYTSNPDSATGDGLAMGWRAGCQVANLEFMQFHPTCLYHPQAKTFLISEAVRGEGGILKDKHGQDFMKAYHAQGSLAPRDVVARAIDSELKKSGDTNVFLDVRHLGGEKIKALFPNIYQTCLEYGFDMAKVMLPVVPAAHYSCGGLVVDENARTAVEGLYALGETACTGLHGANRLASNSLLEALVYADKAANYVLKAARSPAIEVAIPAWNIGHAVPADELVVLSHSWDEIRRLMWHYVGIVRTEKRLRRAINRLRALQDELNMFYWDYQVTDTLLEVRNLAVVAELTVRCAMARKESRGIHFTLDYPEQDLSGHAKDTILVH
jgi:L-aspartate oxidase